MPTPIARSAPLALLLSLPSLIAACTLDTNGANPEDAGAGAQASGTPGAGGGTPGSGGGTPGAGGSAPGSGGGGGMAPTCGGGNQCLDLPMDAEWKPVWMLASPYMAGGMAPNCPDGMAAKPYYKGPATTAQCSPCSCNFAGATCTAPTLVCDIGTDKCGTTGEFVTSPLDTGCKDSTPGQGVAGCQLTAGTSLVPGTCQGDASNVTGPAKWEETLHVCSIPTNGAIACRGGTCLPQSSGGFMSAKTCVAHTGDVDCPAGWMGSEAQAHEDGDDMRSCTSCACGAGTCTGGSVKLNDRPCSSANQGGSVVFNELNKCIVPNDYFDQYGVSFVATPGTVNTGNCTAPTPQGSVVPKGEQLTICCK